MENPNHITYVGKTDFRNAQQMFGIKPKDRLRHMYVIGKTGTGKTTFIENMITQDIANGHGVAFLDPHGSSAEKMLDYIPPERIDDVIYFAPFDVGYPISFNIMEDPGPDKRHHAANGILSVMKKIWVDAFSGRMEYITQNVLLALLEYPDATMLGFNRVLTDNEYRKLVVDNLKDPSVRSFWIDEYGKWDDRYRREAGAAVQNKIGQFTSNPIIRNIIGQPKSSFSFRQVMDEGKVFIGNLSKGLLGEQNAQLMGSLLSTNLYLAAMSRAEFTEDQIEQLPALYLYADEFQNFANDSFADVLSEARKYKLGLIMAHQFIAQLPDTVRDAILGNVGTMVSFRIGPDDAEVFEQQYAPEFVAEDFVNLGFGQWYVKLMIDGMTSRGFSARTIYPILAQRHNMKEQMFLRSRELYGTPRDQVESAIEEWFAPIPSKKQIEHQQYLAKKRAEVEAAGGVWVEDKSPGEYIPPKAQKNNNNRSSSGDGFATRRSRPRSDASRGRKDDRSTRTRSTDRNQDRSGSDTSRVRQKEQSASQEKAQQRPVSAEHSAPNKIKVSDDLKDLLGQLGREQDGGTSKQSSGSAAQSSQKVTHEQVVASKRDIIPDSVKKELRTKQQKPQRASEGGSEKKNQKKTQIPKKQAKKEEHISLEKLKKGGGSSSSQKRDNTQKKTQKTPNKGLKDKSASEGSVSALKDILKQVQKKEVTPQKKSSPSQKTQQQKTPLASQESPSYNAPNAAPEPPRQRAQSDHVATSSTPEVPEDVLRSILE